MLRRLLVQEAPSGAGGGGWRRRRPSLRLAPFSAAASGGDGSGSSSGRGSRGMPPPTHPLSPIHWKGHYLKPIRIKKKGIEAVQVHTYLPGVDGFVGFLKKYVGGRSVYYHLFSRSRRPVSKARLRICPY